MKTLFKLFYYKKDIPFILLETVLGFTFKNFAQSARESNEWKLLAFSSTIPTQMFLREEL